MEAEAFEDVAAVGHRITGRSSVVHVPLILTQLSRNHAHAAVGLLAAADVLLVATQPILILTHKLAHDMAEFVFD